MAGWSIFKFKNLFYFSSWQYTFSGDRPGEHYKRIVLYTFKDS